MDQALSLREHVKQCTVRIRIAGSSLGTGFFVAPNLILTCAHVVQSARRNNEPIEVFLWDGNSLGFGVIEHFVNEELPVKDTITQTHQVNLYPDLALLRIASHDHPCVYLNDTVSDHAPLFSYGYVEAYRSGDGVEFTYEDKSWIDSEKLLLKLREGQASHGFSGAPLLNEATGGICGIVQKTRGSASDIGGRAIPTRIILQTFPELANVQKTFHNQHTQWINSLTSQQARQAGLMPAVKTTEYAQQFCEISNPNGEQWVYRMVQGKNKVTIGRLGELNDITLGPNNCACISHQHCLLRKRDGKWWLIRTGKNYLLIRRKNELNEEEVHEKIKLADGDTIRIVGETSPKGDISWMIRFCDGATTQPVSMTTFLRFDKQQRALYRVVRGGEQLIPLSDQERDLVGFMLEHPGSTYEHNELIRAIWENDPSKTRVNLRNLAYRLRDKIEPPGTKERFLITHPVLGYSLHTRPIDEKK